MNISDDIKFFIVMLDSILLVPQYLDNFWLCGKPCMSLSGLSEGVRATQKRTLSVRCGGENTFSQNVQTGKQRHSE